MTGRSERTPLTAEAAREQVQFSYLSALMVLSTCAVYIALSSSLINYNKFLMHEDRFPHAVPLTSIHMVVSFVLSGLGYMCFGKSAYPGMEVVTKNPGEYMMKLAPMSVLFAISVVLSNQAYFYCSVPFLQMCKQLNVIMTYFVALILSVEKFSVQTLVILCVVMIGCSTSIHGEMDPSAFGFALQISSQVAEVTKVILQQMILQGLRVDPLTMVMTQSPLCLCTLSVGLYFLWEPGTLADAQRMGFHLCLNGLNAFALNVSIALVIRYASGVSFVVAGVVKDILIVLVAAIFFGAVITHMQIVGFTIASLGVAAHALVRSHRDAVDRVLSSMSLWKKEPPTGRDVEA